MSRKKSIRPRLSDFENAQYSNVYDCPIARALKRRFTESRIRVNPDWYQIDDQYYQFSLEFKKYEREVLKYMCGPGKRPKMRRIVVCDMLVSELG